MQYRYYQKLSGCLSMLLLSMILWGQQSSQSDSFRLNRDLRIMEGILDKLLDEDPSSMRLPEDSRGIYIPEYGMIFYLKKTQPYRPMMLRTLEENLNMVVDQTQTKESLKRKIHPSSGQNISSEIKDQFADLQRETEKLENEVLENMKAGIIEFLSNYASSTSLLKTKDRITVLVHLDGWRSHVPQNGFLTAWIDRKHAETLRQSRSSNSLKTDIHFDLNTDQESLTKDIDIMTEILDQAMATGSTPRYASTSGLYLNGLGALLFMEIHPEFWFGNMDTSFSIVIHNLGNAVSGVRFTANANNSGKNTDASSQFQKLSDELFDLMASYGHTLQLKPEEQVILEVNLGPKFSFPGQNREEPSNMRMQMIKRDLDAYNQGKISIKELKKKLIVQIR